MNERKHAKTNEWPGNGILGPVPAPGTIIIILFPFCPPDPPGSWINWLPPTCNQEHQKIRKIQNFFFKFRTNLEEKCFKRGINHFIIVQTFPGLNNNNDTSRGQAVNLWRKKRDLWWNKIWIIIKFVVKLKFLIKNLITNNKNTSLTASTPRVIKIMFIEKKNCSSWDSQ